jgi:hypothetical protein
MMEISKTDECAFARITEGDDAPAIFSVGRGSFQIL